MIGTVIALPGGLYPLWTDDSIPTPVTALVTLLLLAFFTWLIAAAARMATVVDCRGIYVRGFLRTRCLAWADVQDIRVEVNAGAAFQDAAAERVSYAYGFTGRRVQLMYVDDAHVGLDDEIAFLRRTWQELRGVGWAPVAGVPLRIKRGEARRLALLAGLACAMVAAFPLALLMVVAMFADLPGVLETVFSPGIATGVVVPAVFVVAASVTYWRRRNLGQHQGYQR
ncbi:PH domain-containing protein [Streptomyces anandii]|uniref:PH domain-containing protein n=1 Tax=Streptomyces anandii TaxID=285454 RepID=UPI00370007C3